MNTPPRAEASFWESPQRQLPPRRRYGGRDDTGRRRERPRRARPRARVPGSPGHGLRRCFSNSDSSSRNSNQQVCGGVQGRLEVAASRSAASALILPPPPLPPGALPGSNLTLEGGPRAPGRQTQPRERPLAERPENSHTQNGGTTDRRWEAGSAPCTAPEPTVIRVGGAMGGDTLQATPPSGV